MTTGYEGPGFVGGGGAGGAALSAGASSQNSGTITFSNSNGVSFGLNNGVLTATVTPGAAAGVAAIQASNTTYTSGTVNFSNANGISFGSSGPNAITASYTQSGQAFSASGGSSTFSTLSFSNANGATFSNNAGQVALSYTVPGATSFSNANGVSFGLAGSTITASVAAPGVNQALSGSNGSFTASTFTLGNLNGLSFYTSNGSIVASYTVPAGGASPNFSAGTTSGNLGSVVFSNSNNVSFGLNGSTITGSASFTAQTNQTLGIFALGNTTAQSSSNTIDARSFSISATGIVSAGMSGNTLVISSPTAVALTQFSAGLTNSGNTAGNTGAVTGQVLFVGTNNITLSGSTNAGSMTISISGGAGGGGAALSAGTQSVSTGTVSFANSNGVTFGMSGSSQITASVAAQTNQSVGLYALGNTTQNSSTTLDARTLSFNALGAATMGYTNGSIQVSVPVQTSLSFSNLNGVSFGINASTLTASVAAQTNQSVGLYALGNTTQNSSTTLDARTLSFNGLGAMTVGYSAGSIQLSAPASSSLSATGGFSISTNGSTISMGVPAIGTNSFWDPTPPGYQVTTGGQIGQGSVAVFPAPFGGGSAILSQAVVLASISLSSSSNSSMAGVISAYVGVYTRNGSSLSLATSGSQSYQFTNTSSNSQNSIASLRALTIPIAMSMTPGDYWVGFMSKTSSTNANWFTASNVVGSMLSNQLAGQIGQAQSNTYQLRPGLGVFSVTSAGMPASIAFNAITGMGSAGSNNIPYVNFNNFSV